MTAGALCRPWAHPRLPSVRKVGNSAAMEKLFGHPGFKSFTLQDRKRLPSRFFARVTFTQLARLG